MLYSLPANTFMNLPLRSALGTSKFSFTSVWTGEGSGAELGVPGEVEGQLLVAGAPLQVPVDAVVSPPGVLVDSGHLEVSTVWGVPPVLPRDGGGEGLAIGEGLGGGEPLVGHGEVSLAQLLAVPGDLTLVAAAGLGNIASILVDLGLGVKLVHHNILVLLVPEELKVA